MTERNESTRKTTSPQERTGCDQGPRTSHGQRSNRYRWPGRGTVALVAGTALLSTHALLGAGGTASSGEVFVPPGMMCGSPFSCKEPRGTVLQSEPGGIGDFLEGKAHDAKLLAASAFAPESASARHVPTGSGGACACPLCCAAASQGTTPGQQELQVRREPLEAAGEDAAVPDEGGVGPNAGGEDE